MSIIMFPEHALNAGLSPANLTIYIYLLQLHPHHAHGKYDEEFCISDRELAEISGRSCSTITEAKKRLRDLNLIQFRAVTTHITYYKIILPVD